MRQLAIIGLFALAACGSEWPEFKQGQYILQLQEAQAPREIDGGLVIHGGGVPLETWGIELKRRKGDWELHHEAGVDRGFEALGVITLGGLCEGNPWRMVWELRPARSAFYGEAMRVECGSSIILERFAVIAVRVEL